MIDQEIRNRLRVRVTDGKELENELDRAVEEMIQEGLKKPRPRSDGYPT
jgi:hypothetical protein